MAISRDIRVLALPRYDRDGASSRVRMFQFEKFLVHGGLRVTWAPMLDAGYLEHLYATGSRSGPHTARCYLRRVRQLFDLRQYDVIWLEKELWPWAPTLVDPGILRGRAPYVVDYDDAIFHNYDQHSSAVVRSAFGRKIDAVMRAAHTVVAGNEYLAARARGAGAKRVVILPSVVDRDAYARRQVAHDDGVVVGWIGSPGSQALLEPLFPILEGCLGDDDTFVTVGARFDGPRLRGHIVRPWSLDSEAALVGSFDIGVMPVRDAPFERGKCGYKLIQYMAAGVPVVASPVGVNRDIVIDGETGYLADTPEEWREAVSRLKRDPLLRTAMGTAGRRLVEQRYCTQVVGPQLSATLRLAAGMDG